MQVQTASSLILSLALLASPVLAQNSANTPLNARAELAQQLPQAKFLGQTRLSIWGFQIYDARLWATPGFRSDQLGSAAFALELSYLRDFSNTDIAERSLEEMRRFASITPAQTANWTAELLRVIPMVKKSDRIMAVNLPGQGVRFLFNGEPTGEVLDAQFARLFFAIWLSPKTSEPKMRDELLQGAM